MKVRNPPRYDSHTGRRAQVTAYEAARPQCAGRTRQVEEVGERVTHHLVDVVKPAGIEAWQDEVRVGGARTLERLGKVHQLVGEAAGQDATVGVRDGRHRSRSAPRRLATAAGAQLLAAYHGPLT